MTDKTTRDKDLARTSGQNEKHFWGWFLFPVSTLPLVALMTYNWQTMLKIPPEPSSNWFGPLGDMFAYAGYEIFGLAIWLVPVFCLVGGCRIVAGASIRPGVKSLWRLALLVSTACLVQVMESHAPGIAAARVRINATNAGGIVGYLIMTKAVAPLLSDIGASVLMLLLMAVSLVGSIGAGNIVAFFTALGRWASGAGPKFDPHGMEPGTPEYDEAQQAFEAAVKAREEAKRQREEEKRRIREEKEAAKRAKEAEKEAAWQRRQEEIAAQRAAAASRAEREAAARQTAAEQRQEPAAAPAAAAVAMPQPVPQPKKPKPASGPEEEKAEPEDKGPYILPGVNLLNPLKASAADHSDVGTMSQKLIDTLKLFNVDATMSYTVQGPVVTKYALLLAPGTRYSAVTGIADNLKGALHAKSLRIEAPIPGEECIGIEVPNLKPAGISFREIFESDAWKNSKAELPLLFGKRADGKELVSDLASMPHMLVAGATGQGKSVCLNSLICGLLMTRTPEQLKLIMVDPKCVEFTPYSSIPHLLVPVITDNRKVVFSLHWAVAEMEKRLKLFARARVRNIYDFNHRKTVTQTDMFGNDSEVGTDMPKTVPYIVIIIDEAADLIGQCGKDVNPDIQRITQKARAAGIHLILATQRPDAKIITGAIKANIPGRVAFKTASSVDSRTILDDNGAENLIGKGDMLFKGKDGLLIRAQGAWISDGEIANITSFIEQHANTQFDEKFATKLGRVKEADIDDPFKDNEDDPDNQQPQETETKAAQRQLVKAAADADDFKKAVECIINTKRASTSHFQRQMGWGYNHAAKILDLLTERGIVSPQQGMGPRQIILDQDQLVAILNGDSATAVESAANAGGETAGGETASGEAAAPDSEEDATIEEQES